MRLGTGPAGPGHVRGQGFARRIRPPPPSTRPVAGPPVAARLHGTPSFLSALWETLAIAVVGTAFAAAAALPLAVCVARTTAPWPWLSPPLRGLLNGMRAIDTAIFALLFVAVVGLGPFAGALGVAFHTSGSMAKLFAEVLKGIPQETIEAAEATGASRAFGSRTSSRRRSTWPARPRFGSPTRRASTKAPRAGNNCSCRASPWPSRRTSILRRVRPLGRLPGGQSRALRLRERGAARRQLAILNGAPLLDTRRRPAIIQPSPPRSANASAAADGSDREATW